MSHPRIFRFLLSFVTILALVATSKVRAQDAAALEGKVSALDERTTTLETDVAKLKQLKISGYVQPQWQWTDIDTNGAPNAGDQTKNRNFFTIRRGRVKFQHTTDNVYYTLYPDITENGVILKEAYAGWKAVKDLLDISMGAMNRPFGYEIAYSSSAREVTERSLAENRLFNGERDLGLQFAVTPTFGGVHPLLEVGLFNGSDNFGKGPVVFNPANTVADFSTVAIGGTTAPKFVAGTSDTNRVKAITASLTNEAALFNGGYRENGKELIGHIRVPFLLSDDFSFDIGGSWSLGGITEPSDLRGEYTSTGLTFKTDGKGPSGTFNAKSGNDVFGLLAGNRSIFGADAQFYLSVLPFGGTIVKVELYTGQMPFYGTSALLDSATLAQVGGVARPSTILKDVMGFYAMLVQNITDNYQLAVRYDVFDPNTKIKGTDFATLRSGTFNSGAGFGQDLAQSTLTVDVNVFISGAMRLMLDYDKVMNEDFTRVVNGTTITQADPKDDRFTFRMQYKF